MCVLSRVRLFVTSGIVALQSPLCMKFSKQEYWSGLPFPSLGDLPNPGIEPMSLASPELAEKNILKVEKKKKKQSLKKLNKHKNQSQIRQKSWNYQAKSSQIIINMVTIFF